MPIGTQGQYIFKFNISDKKDFIDSRDLHKFEIVEEAGNILPSFSLDFSSLDKNMLRLLHEGNDLEVSFGKDEKSLKTVKLNITKLRTVKEGDSKRLVNIRGIMSFLKFNNQPNLLITSKKSGVEVILDIAKKHFGSKIDTNITKSIDKQNWIQYNIPDKLFINDLWMHSWIPNSFLALGISMDGTFIVRDVLKYIKDLQSKAKDQERYKYRFIGKREYINDLPYYGDYILDTEYGFINYWQGYKRNKLTYSFEDGTDSYLSEDVKPILALTNKLIRHSEIESRFSNIGFTNENVHNKYWNAYLRNISSLALFSSTKLEFCFDNVLEDVKLLDLIMFQEPMVNEKQLSGDEISGYYLVGKVARTLTSNGLVTTVLACREALNQPKGVLKKS